MKIFLTGYHPINDHRIDFLKKGLIGLGADVIDCRHKTLQNKKIISRWRHIFYHLKEIFKDFLYFFTTLSEFIRYAWDADFILVGFPFKYDVLFNWPLAKITNKRVVVDFFMSNYDTSVNDRKIIPPDSIIAKQCYFIDWTSLKLADIAIVDTEEHKKYFCREFDIIPSKMRIIHVGSDESVFYPMKKSKKEFIVYFHGYFTPLHGIEKIIEAASMIPDCKFILVGEGQTKAKAMALSKKLKTKNVHFLKKQSLAKLPLSLKEADICLGIFGDSEKAKRVIPYKVYNALAMKKPVITARTPASEGILEHGINAYLCKNTPEDIAKAIIELKNDNELRKSIALNGYKLFKENFTTERLGIKLINILKKEYY